MSNLLISLKGAEVLLGLCALLYSCIIYRRRKSFPYPPGPKGLPVFGNISHASESWPWIEYEKMSRDFNSPVIHLEALGNHTVIINDAHTAHEVLEKRSAIYSDRPSLHFIKKVAGFDWHWAFAHYGSYWRLCRRLSNIFFREAATRNFRGQEMIATHNLLIRLLDSPEEYYDHIHLFSAQLILDIGYGIKVHSHNDKLVGIMERGGHVLESILMKNSVDLLPWTRYLPAWLPGMAWKTITKDWKKHTTALRDAPFDHAKESIKNGTAKSSVVLSLMQRVENSNDIISEKVMRSVAATIFVAGSDTSGSLLSALFAIMMAYPEVQRKAQEELDQIVGQDRLPSFSDKSNLPYVNALCKEITRWTCVVPLGVHHRNTEDDLIEINGKPHLIPKGSTIFPNAWAMCRDAKTYSSPERFMPSRFMAEDMTKLNPDVKDPDVVFGFRSRVCPGRFLAEDTQFITVSSVLTCFRIEPADKNWKLDFQDVFSPGFVLYAKKQKCNIIPRSRESAELIRNTE